MGEKNSTAGQFYTANPKKDPSLCGTVIMKKKDFYLAGQYDEAFRGWGGEDLELYERLKNRSIQQGFINDKKISAIKHGDDIRQLSIEKGGAGSKKKALAITRLYTRIITELYKKRKILKLSERLTIMEQIKKFAAKAEEKGGESKFQLTISNKDGTTPVFRFNCVITF